MRDRDRNQPHRYRAVDRLFARTGDSDVGDLAGICRIPRILGVHESQAGVKVQRVHQVALAAV